MTIVNSKYIIANEQVIIYVDADPIIMSCDDYLFWEKI